MRGTETITWTLKSGAAVTVTVSLVRNERHVGTDEWTGEAITRDEGLSIAIKAETGGTVIGTQYHRLTDREREHPAYAAYVATIGKLAITEDNAARIDAAIATLQADPDYVAQEQRRAEAEAASEAHEAHVRRINRAL